MASSIEGKEGEAGKADWADICRKIYFHTSINRTELLEMTMKELFIILEDFEEELSIKLVGNVGLFGGGTGKSEKGESEETTAEDVDAFFHDF